MTRPVAEAQSEATSVPVTLQVAHRVEFGQAVKACGNEDELGGWNPKSTPAMEWSEGDVWTVTLDLPRGSSVEFKFVTDEERGTSWEGGPNRTFVVPADAAPGAAYLLVCTWGNPAEPSQLVPASPEAASIDTSDEEGGGGGGGVSTGTVDKVETEGTASPQNVGKMTVDTSDSNAVSEVGKMSVEGEPSRNPQTEMGKMTIESAQAEDMGVGAEEDASQAVEQTPKVDPDEDPESESPLSKVASVFSQVH